MIEHLILNAWCWHVTPATFRGLMDVQARIRIRAEEERIINSEAGITFIDENPEQLKERAGIGWE